MLSSDTHTQKGYTHTIYSEELTHTITEAEKAQGLQSARWRTRRPRCGSSLNPKAWEPGELIV